MQYRLDCCFHVYIMQTSAAAGNLQGHLDPLAGHERYQTLRLLGQGTSGFVVHAFDRYTSKDVAIKLMERESLSPFARGELLNHSVLRHPQVVQLKGLFLTQKHLCIVLEFVSGGDLFKFVQAHKTLPESVARYMFQQIIIALDYCHRRGIANRDLKLEDMLLQDMPSWPLPLLKISDFGYSAVLGDVACKEAPKSPVGTITYMAPEVLFCQQGMGRSSSYNAKSADIWSCGVMLYTMLYGAYPFDFTSTDAVQHVLETLDSMVNFKLPARHDVVVSEQCRHLLEQLLHPNPVKRIQIQNILKDPWFQKGLPADAITRNDEYLLTENPVVVAVAVERIEQILERLQ